MLFDILAAFLIAGAVILFLWLLRGMLLMPLKKGEHTNLTVTVSVSGAEPALEQTVKGLCWLRSNGTLPGDVVIEDQGMDRETREVAERLAASQQGVSCRRKEVAVCQKNREKANCTEESIP